MRLLLMIMVLLVALPVAADDNYEAVVLFENGDQLDCGWFDLQTGIYHADTSCLPDGRMSIDLDAYGLIRRHWQVSYRYEYSKANRWQQASGTFTLGDGQGAPEGVTWLDVIPDKVLYFPKEHNRIRDVSVVAYLRDAGVPVVERSAGELKSTYAR